MKVFLSYASEWKPQAEAIAFALRSRGHQVFFDRDDLPDGESYDDKIQQAIARSDMMIFLITPEAVEKGRYTLTELRFARAKWPSPSGRVLPVKLAETPMADTPAYLKAVTILEPQGAAPAEVAFALERLRGPERAFNIAALVALTGAPLAALAGLMPVSHEDSWLGFDVTLPGANDIALEVGLLAALWLMLLYWRLGALSWRAAATLAVLVPVSWVATIYAAEFLLTDGVTRSFAGGAGDSARQAFFELQRGLTDAQRVSLAGAMERLSDYLSTGRDRSRAFAYALQFGLLAAIMAGGVMIAFALIDRGFRNATRWALFLFFALIAGAIGSLFVPEGMDYPDIWIFRPVDLAFGLLYLPWFLLCPSALAFWLVRGQDR